MLENLWLKITGTFKQQTRTPLKLPKILDVVKKEIKIEQILQISVHTDMKSTKKTIFQQKNPKSFHSWSNHF